MVPSNNMSTIVRSISRFLHKTPGWKFPSNTIHILSLLWWKICSADVPHISRCYVFLQLTRTIPARKKKERLCAALSGLERSRDALNWVGLPQLWTMSMHNCQWAYPDGSRVRFKPPELFCVLYSMFRQKPDILFLHGLELQAQLKQIRNSLSSFSRIIWSHSSLTCPAKRAPRDSESFDSSLGMW